MDMISGRLRVRHPLTNAKQFEKTRSNSRSSARVATRLLLRSEGEGEQVPIGVYCVHSHSRRQPCKPQSTCWTAHFIYQPEGAQRVRDQREDDRTVPVQTCAPALFASNRANIQIDDTCPTRTYLALLEGAGAYPYTSSIEARGVPRRSQRLLFRRAIGSLRHKFVRPRPGRKRADLNRQFT